MKPSNNNTNKYKPVFVWLVWSLSTSTQLSFSNSRPNKYSKTTNENRSSFNFIKPHSKSFIASRSEMISSRKVFVRFCQKQPKSIVVVFFFNLEEFMGLFCWCLQAAREKWRCNQRWFLWAFCRRKTHRSAATGIHFRWFAIWDRLRQTMFM